MAIATMKQKPTTQRTGFFMVYEFTRIMVLSEKNGRQGIPFTAMGTASAIFGVGRTEQSGAERRANDLQFCSLRKTR
jgi:hypothetical protein